MLTLIEKCNNFFVSERERGGGCKQTSCIKLFISRPYLSDIKTAYWKTAFP